MAQRESGYERKERDLYETPAWVTGILIPYIPDELKSYIWEPACASGKMATTLDAHYATDLVTDYGESDVNFLSVLNLPENCKTIITNPPFNREAEKFIRHALTLTKEVNGFVAMLLPVDFDSAKTRRDMFNDCPAFNKKIVLTKRIVWFENPETTAGPSSNHAWFVWDWSRDTDKPATIHYGFS